MNPQNIKKIKKIGRLLPSDNGKKLHVFKKKQKNHKMKFQKAQKIINSTKMPRKIINEFCKQETTSKP